MEEEHAARCKIYAAHAAAKQLCAIVAQLEYYFGDENLPSDEFLYRKTMKGNAKAFVQIKTLLSFNKMRRFRADESQVGAAILWRKASAGRNALLELSADGKQIRRTRPLSESPFADLGALKKSVRVENLESLASPGIRQHPTPAIVQSYFEKKFGVGAVETVEVLSSTAKKNRFPSRPYALVMFKSEEITGQAISMHAQNGWRELLVKQLQNVRTVVEDDLKKVDKENSKVCAAVSPPSDDNDLSSSHENADTVPIGTELEATESSTKKDTRRYTGKVRTLDTENQEGFVVPEAPASKGSGSNNPKKKKKQKQHRVGSIFFSYKEDTQLRSKLRVGSVISYNVEQTSDGGKAVNIKIEFPSALPATDLKDDEVANDANRPRFSMKRKSIAPRGPQNTIGIEDFRSGFGYYAKGPPNNASKYHGFGPKEWRYLPGRSKKAVEQVDNPEI